MSLTISGTDKLMRRLHAVGDGRQILTRLQLRTVANAKARVSRKTGNLGRSITPGPLTDKYAIVRASANYAAYVEFGTKPHIIRPKNGKALAWPANAAGRRLSGRPRKGAEMVFATVVHHPGTKAQPFLIPGAKEAIDQEGARAIVDAWNSAA